MSVTLSAILVHQKDIEENLKKVIHDFEFRTGLMVTKITPIHDVTLYGDGWFVDSVEVDLKVIQ